jgi:hypothetical protein
VSRSSANRDTNLEKLRRDISDFEASASAMIAKMRKSAKRLNELDVEADLRLRQDLIEMESRSVFEILQKRNEKLLISYGSNSTPQEPNITYPYEESTHVV